MSRIQPLLLLLAQVHWLHRLLRMQLRHKAGGDKFWFATQALFQASASSGPLLFRRIFYLSVPSDWTGFRGVFESLSSPALSIRGACSEMGEAGGFRGRDRPTVHHQELVPHESRQREGGREGVTEREVDRS